MYNAARNGDLKRVQELVEQGADMDERGPHGWTPLNYFFYRGQLETVRYFPMDKSKNLEVGDKIQQYVEIQRL